MILFLFTLALPTCLEECLVFFPEQCKWLFTSINWVILVKTTIEDCQSCVIPYQEFQDWHQHLRGELLAVGYQHELLNVGQHETPAIKSRVSYPDRKQRGVRF